jgi:Family of unknown function (DUF5989)
MAFLQEFAAFVWHHKRKFYLMPIFVMMLLIGTLIVFSKGSVVAPFIYTLF